MNASKACATTSSASLQKKENLEREVIQLFRKCKHVDSIETEDRVYRVEKRVERDKREKIIEHLSHHLSENGAEASQLNDIHQWKKKCSVPRRNEHWSS